MSNKSATENEAIYDPITYFRKMTAKATSQSSSQLWIAPIYTDFVMHRKNKEIVGLVILWAYSHAETESVTTFGQKYLVQCNDLFDLRKVIAETFFTWILSNCISPPMNYTHPYSMFTRLIKHYQIINKVGNVINSSITNIANIVFSMMTVAVPTNFVFQTDYYRYVNFAICALESAGMCRFPEFRSPMFDREIVKSILELQKLSTTNVEW